MTAPQPGNRALIGARVSKVKDIKTKTSHLVQHEQGVQWSQSNGMEIAGFFEDLNVSAGKVTPFDRPELKPWLNERIYEWDVIVITKSDRLFRSGWDCAQLMQWAKANEKMMVIIDDSIRLDYRKNSNVSPSDLQFQELMLTIGAKFGEMELERIKARARDTRQYLNTTTRWPGGAAPWGYKIVEHPEGGKTLAIDEEWAQSVRDAAKWLLAGVTFYDVASRLNDAKVPTPLAKAYDPDTSSRKSAPSTLWTSHTVKSYFKGPASLGIKRTGARSNNDRSLRDEDGMPIQLAKGIISQEDWNAIQEVIGKPATYRSRNAAPLLGIAICGGCGRNLYLFRNSGRGRQDVYSCKKTKQNPHRCGAGFNFLTSTIESVINDVLLPDLEKIPYPEYVWRKGRDSSEELDRVKQILVDLEDEWDEGLMTDRERYISRKRKLIEQQRELEKEPYEPSGWVEVETGKTYADRFNEMLTDEERRQFFLACGISVVCGPNKLSYEVVVSSDLAERAKRYGVALAEQTATLRAV